MSEFDAMRSVCTRLYGCHTTVSEIDRHRFLRRKSSRSEWIGPAGLTRAVALDKPSQVILEIQAGQCPLENARVEMLSLSPEVGFELDGATTLDKDHGACHLKCNYEMFVRSLDQSSRCPRRDCLWEM